MQSELGFISIHRKIKQWEWYTDIPTKVLFIHCLLKANYTNKRWRGELIERGSFISSYGNLAKETGLSVRQVRTAIKHLEMTHEVTRIPKAKYTLFKVLKYNDYQLPDTQTDKQPTNNRQTTDKQVTTTNKDNKYNNKNKYIYRKPVISQTWDDVVEDNPMSEEERQMLIDEIERMKEKDD